MKLLCAAGLFAYAQCQDETSLMQGLALRVENKLSVAGMSTQEGRHDATERLMETATKMMKNGVTPDVVTFIIAAITEVNETVLPAILDEHEQDQIEIDHFLAQYQAVVDALELAAGSITVIHDDRVIASEAHKQCRSSQALDCARSRRCEEELEQAWIVVKREESEMRLIHHRIEQEWCVHPPGSVHPDTSDPFHWPDGKYHEGPETSQIEFDYFALELAPDVVDFRSVSVTEFGLYVVQKPIVHAAWVFYNAKVEECAELETVLESQVEECDLAQDVLQGKACAHAAANREARRNFGHGLHDALNDYNRVRAEIEQQEFDRKREWETLHQVTCILQRVYTHVIDAIDSGDPCITEESHPDQTHEEIRHCAEVNEGFTEHLTIIYHPLPVIVDPPPVVEHACSAEYVYDEQGSFTRAIQDSHNQHLSADATLANYFTVLSAHGWAGCAAPKVCIPCEGMEVEVPSPDYTEPATACKLHEEYLRPGESNLDSFRCTGVTIGGTPFCVPMSARCNGVANCGDGSDELGCATAWMRPAVLQESSTEECRSDANVVPGTSDDVQFFCNNGQCTSIEGRCNGFRNCAGDDDSDEQGCVVGIGGTSIEATSGLQTSLENPSVGSSVFYDREYTFDSLGSFSGKTFVKMSNDDKHTFHSHVQVKVRLPQPTTLYVVKLTDHELPWLASGGWHRSDLTGVSYSGSRQTRHTEWSQNVHEEHFGPGIVFEQTFTAGTVSMPGNSGGDGSYLLFLANPNNPPQPPTLGYNLALADSKCPHNHDRLFRNPDGNVGAAITLTECHAQCQRTNTCNHFSYGAHGGVYVCMGCTTLANAQAHTGFTAYDMVATNAT